LNGKQNLEGRLKQRIFRSRQKLKGVEEESRNLRAQLERARAENSLLAAIISGLGEALCVEGRDLRVRFQNEPDRAVIGDPRGRPWAVDRTLADGTKPCVGNRIPTTQGLRRGEVTTTPLLDGRDEIVGGVKRVRDISGRKQAEELPHSRQFLASLIRGITDPLAVFNRELQIVHANDAWALWANRVPDEVLGQQCADLWEGRCTGCTACAVEKTFHSHDPCAAERRVPQESGVDRWLQVYTYPIFGKDGSVTHVVECGRDVTDRKRTEKEHQVALRRLKRLARTDALTGLNNRRVLMERLDLELARWERSHNELSVILCDIDRFKFINDTLGHGIGDEILANVGDLLQTGIRRTDCVGRYGGDEFLIILPDTGLKGAMDLAEQIRQRVRGRTFHVGGTLDVGITFSLGVASPLTLACTSASLMRAADEALYDAKRGGRDRVCEYHLTRVCR